MANLNNRMQIKRTYVSGRLPNTTDPSNSQYIAAGEFALNMPDKTLYTSDGQLLITVGSTASVLRVNDSISIGDVSNNLLTINSSAIFAGNTSVSTAVRTTSVAVQNSSSNISISPTTIFVGNNSSNVTVDMTGGTISIPIASANINSNAVVTIQTSINHGITTLTQSKLFVNTSQVSLNTANYSSDYNPIGFDIRDIPTPNTISFVLPNDSFKGVAPGNRTIASINRATNGVVTVVTNGPHYYSNGDFVYASGVGYNLADFYISGGSIATVINSTTLTYTQNNYASSTRSLVGAKAQIYTPVVPGPYYFWIEAADPTFNGYIAGDYITYSGLAQTIAFPGFNNNAYSPSFFNGNLLIEQVQINTTGYKTVLIYGNENLQNELYRYLYPANAPYTLTQGAVVISYIETGRVNNNSQLCPVLASTSISGSIISTLPTGISIKSGSKLVYVLDSVVFVGNSSIGNIVDSKGSRAYRPNVIEATPVPTYSVIPNTYYINEGGTVTFNVTTTNFGSGTLYWTNIGTTTGADFTNGLNAGSINITNESGAFNLTLSSDLLLEGPESIVIQLHTGSTAGPVVTTSYTVSVSDTSFPPSYSIIPSVRSINEGGSVTFTVTTTGIADGTTLYWTNGGTTIGADFDNGLNSGSIIINNNSNSIIRTISNDFISEGPETVVLQLRDGSGVLKATALTVTVNDTSIETYSVTPSTTSINEGQTLIFTIATQGVPNGTTLYWTNSGTTTGADFTNTSNLNYGQFTTTGNTTTVSLILSNDVLLEGPESIIFQLRTNSITGSIVATATSVTVNDTSYPTYSISPSATSVNEGGTVTFTVTTTNVPNNTTLFWSNEGTTIGADFTDGYNANSFIISSGSGSISRTLANDVLLEGTESIRLQIRTGSTTGQAVPNGLSANVNVIDTSVAAIPYTITSVTPSTSSVNEGVSVTFTVVTSAIPSGTTLYWKNIGTTIGADFTDGINSDSFIVTNGSGTITRILSNDALTEGSETIAIQIYKDSVNGTILYNPVSLSTVTVNDTSTGTYAVTASVAFVDEGADVIFTITTSGVPLNKLLYWDTVGTATAADFKDNLIFGPFVLTSSTITIKRSILADKITENQENFTFRIFEIIDSVVNIKATVPVIINDTSQADIVVPATPDYKWAMPLYTQTVTRNGTVFFIITGTPGTSVRYNIYAKTSSSIAPIISEYISFTSSYPTHTIVVYNKIGSYAYGGTGGISTASLLFNTVWPVTLYADYNISSVYTPDGARSGVASGAPIITFT